MLGSPGDLRGPNQLRNDPFSLGRFRKCIRRGRRRLGLSEDDAADQDDQDGGDDAEGRDE